MIPGLKIIDDILKGLPENARLRSELADLRAEIQRLHAANEKLQSELRDAHAEIQRLKPDKELSDAQREVLLQLMQNDAGLTVEEIADSIGEVSSMTRHYCEELAGIEFVAQTRFSGDHRRIEGSDFGFALTKEGRKWIAQQSA